MTIALAKSLVQEGQCLASAAAEVTWGRRGLAAAAAAARAALAVNDSEQPTRLGCLKKTCPQAYWRERDTGCCVSGYSRQTAE